ncbi:hypothetical protein ACX80E_14910 [Arthrobacter sp. TMN-49]
MTDANCQALLPIIERARFKFSGLPVTVDLMDAKHVDASALALLERSNPCPAAEGENGLLLAVGVRIAAPQVLPDHRRSP